MVTKIKAYKREFQGNIRPRRVDEDPYRYGFALAEASEAWARDYPDIWERYKREGTE